MTSPRRSVLDLAPLELDCMNTLWPMGQGTVREIRDRLAERRPRAYTTIMTIMDRLARKGVVERVKIGRAYSYRPNLTVEQARSQALLQLIDGFFGGSREAALAQLNGSPRMETPAASQPLVARVRAAAASVSAGAFPAPAESTSPARTDAAAKTSQPANSLAGDDLIDETLL